MPTYARFWCQMDCFSQYTPHGLAHEYVAWLCGISQLPYRVGHELGHDHVLSVQMSTWPVTRACLWPLNGSQSSVVDDVESNTPAFVHEVAQFESKPVLAEEFKANVDDDLEIAEFWLENTIRVFDELSYTSAECLKYAVSFLRDTVYQWWNTLVSVVLKERVTWEFFQAEFKKKFISQRFIDQKHKEFLELKQGPIMCKRFKDGLNEDIRLLVGILEMKEFVVLVDRASTRGRPLRNVGNVTISRGTKKDSAVRSEARVPVRAYAIRAREDASSPDVITVRVYLLSLPGL
ncbi:DNA-dependent protein kinase catalytic subunit [Gossypium arboreum]|uniref:DNA-dependent protein kinase catalytic subunit n=1 Tax=Gossypium arboreum TaxID=29729 RepID=A0A0B0N0U5_GOSAR|nr:DNA-dependent protein kinase catalytic subunit [Gossypium arboreum]